MIYLIVGVIVCLHNITYNQSSYSFDLQITIISDQAFLILMTLLLI